MKKILFLLLCLCPLAAFPQGGITFDVEPLEAPAELLEDREAGEIFARLVRLDAGEGASDLSEARRKRIESTILARSASDREMVFFGFNPFFNSMYRAYADHRPFVLSPDMIWLLVSQGFARHVNLDAERFRDRMTGTEGKIELLVRADDVRLDDPHAPWESVFGGFSRQIAAHVGDDLVGTLECDFTTSTPVSKAASAITVMEAVKPYFEFVVLRLVCGIPRITLEGTPDDWKKVREKAGRLRRYGLDWWIDELDPVLEQFVRASEGDIDRTFWRDMFKCHSPERYGAPRQVDGWIVRFFPYDKYGRRSDLRVVSLDDRLPDETVRVDIRYVEQAPDGTVLRTTPLVLWAGFVGAEQNPETFALKPQMGWMVRRKDDERKSRDARLAALKGRDVELRVGSVLPEELSKRRKIGRLNLIFENEVRLPDWIAGIDIERLIITGPVSESELDRIVELVPPETFLFINRQVYEGRRKKKP